MCIFTSFHSGGGGVFLIGLSFLLLPWLLARALRGSCHPPADERDDARAMRQRSSWSDGASDDPAACGGVCPRCRSMNPRQARFCGQCGEALGQ
jgi:hypothetical protein